MAIKIILKASGLHNTYSICDSVCNGEEAVEIVKHNIRSNNKC